MANNDDSLEMLAENQLNDKQIAAIASLLLVVSSLASIVDDETTEADARSEVTRRMDNIVYNATAIKAALGEQK